VVLAPHPMVNVAVFFIKISRSKFTELCQPKLVVERFDRFFGVLFKIPKGMIQVEENVFIIF
jgi:hypothetical protein